MKWAISKLLRSISTFSLVTLLSRVTGLARELSLAYFFGASVELDLFWIAFRIPNFLRRLSAEGAFSQAVIPVLSEYRAQLGDYAQTGTSQAKLQLQQFINQLISWMTIILILVTMAAQLGAPSLVWIFAPGVAGDSAKLHLTATLLRIMFPALVFISLAAFSGSILNSYQHFGIPAFAQNWCNITLVLIVWLLAPQSSSPVQLLAWGVLGASVLQWLFQLPSLQQIRLVPRFVPPRLDPGVRRVGKLMIPALFGVSVAQLNLLIDTFLLSFLPAGSVSWMNYADRITSLPLGVVGVAIAVVILPKLSQKHYQHQHDQLVAIIHWALRLMLLIALPCVVVLLLLAEPIISTLFQRGAFHWSDVTMTAKALRYLALGIPAFMGVKILAACFYAKQDLRRPVQIAACALTANALLATLLSRYLQHAGMALAITLSSYLNAGLLYYKLQPDLATPNTAVSGNYVHAAANNLLTQRYWFKLSYGLLVMGLVTVLANLSLAGASSGAVLDQHWQLLSSSRRLLHLVILLSLALSSYLGTLLLVRMPFKQILQVNYE